MSRFSRHIFCVICMLAAGTASAQEKLRYLGDEIATRAFMLDLATLFQAETGVEVRMATTGVQTAIGAATTGKVDLIGASRPAHDAAGSRLNHYTIAWDALVAIAHPDNIASRLSVEELRGVLTGTIDDWSKLGGFAEEIKLYLPARIDSGVSYTLRSLLFNDPDAVLASDLTFEDLEALQVAVAAVPNALGITTYSRAMRLGELPVKLLALEGVVPSQDSLAAGEYLLYMPLYLLARPDNALAERFIRFAQGSLAKRIMRRADIVPYMDGFKLIARQFERENRIRRAAQEAALEE